MRLVWVSHVGGDSLGGAERNLVEGASGLRDRGVEVTVVVPSRGRLAAALEETGVSVLEVPHVWWAWSGRLSTWRRARQSFSAVHHSAGALRKLEAVLRKEQPDLVVTNTLAVPIGAIAARRMGLPHVWYVHELGHGMGFLLGERLTLRLVDRLSKLVVVNSRSVQKKYELLDFGTKLELVYAAVEMPPSPLQPAERVAHLELVQVGMIARHKGQADALVAVGLLVSRGIDVRLRLVGGGGSERYMGLLEGLMQELGIRDRVDFVGFSDDPSPYVSGADVALMCSRDEAFGRVTVEAMKLGTPVVGARRGGTVELIEDGRTGLLYTPGDGEELAGQLELLHRDEELRRRLGANAQAWALETFTRERHTGELLKAFDRALGGPAS